MTISPQQKTRIISCCGSCAGKVYASPSGPQVPKGDIPERLGAPCYFTQSFHREIHGDKHGCCRRNSNGETTVSTSVLKNRLPFKRGHRLQRREQILQRRKVCLVVESLGRRVLAEDSKIPFALCIKGVIIQKPQDAALYPVGAVTIDAINLTVQDVPCIEGTMKWSAIPRTTQQGKGAGRESSIHR